MRTVAAVTSGPMPSPGISVILCVRVDAIAEFPSLLGESLARVVAPGFRILAAQQTFELFLELVHVLEIAVNTGKANVGDRIDLLQPKHNQLADRCRRPLTLRRIDNERLGCINNRLHLRYRNLAFLARVQQPGEHLLAVKLLPAAVLLHNHVWNLIQPLIRREALRAALALAASADGIGVLTLAGVDHLVLSKAAIRTFHATSILSSSGADSCTSPNRILSSANGFAAARRITQAHAFDARCDQTRRHNP